MPPQPVREGYRETRSSSSMSSMLCCTSSRSQKVVSYKESQKKFLWLDPNRWTGQKKEKVWDAHSFFVYMVLHYTVVVVYHDYIIGHEYG